MSGLKKEYARHVGMKNVVGCYKEFFGYFNALETNGDITSKQTMKILCGPSKKIWT